MIRDPAVLSCLSRDPFLKSYRANSFRQEAMGAKKCRRLLSENFQTPSCLLPELPPALLPNPSICSPENRSDFLAKVLWHQRLSPVCFPWPPPTQNSNTMTQMDCSQVKPQSKVYKALLNISNSCGTNTPDINASQQQSECFMSVAPRPAHSPDARLQLCPCLAHQPTRTRERDISNWKDNHAEPSGQGPGDRFICKHLFLKRREKQTSTKSPSLLPVCSS